MDYDTQEIRTTSMASEITHARGEAWDPDLASGFDITLAPAENLHNLRNTVEKIDDLFEYPRAKREESGWIERLGIVDPTNRDEWRETVMVYAQFNESDLTSKEREVNRAKEECLGVSFEFDYNGNKTDVGEIHPSATRLHDSRTPGQRMASNLRYGEYCKELKPKIQAVEKEWKRNKKIASIFESLSEDHVFRRDLKTSISGLTGEPEGEFDQDAEDALIEDAEGVFIDYVGEAIYDLKNGGCLTANIVRIGGNEKKLGTGDRYDPIRLFVAGCSDELLNETSTSYGQPCIAQYMLHEEYPRHKDAINKCITIERSRRAKEIDKGFAR